MSVPHSCICGECRQSDPGCQHEAALLEAIDTVRWGAQTIHQAYHQEYQGTYLECPRNTCDAAKQLIKKYAAAKRWLTR